VAAADFDAALATITRAREVGDAHDARVETARWLMSEAEIRMHRGELARMDELFVQIDALRTGDDVQLHEKVRALKGVAALAHGDTRSAAELVAIALANGDPRPDFAIDAADALAARAEALRRDGDADTAARELAPVLAKFREQHPRLPERGRLALASAWVLHDLARDREAIAHFDEALVTLVDPSERAWAELGRRVAEGGAIEPELGDRVHAALARWPGSHRYELDVLARLR
ncbi:MAG TPA: hypothetical protein VG755_14135, partial [Nannocystaceae bacterium]|nr:hypothetical protein [Nannocystaceae bacterium]